MSLELQALRAYQDCPFFQWMLRKGVSFSVIVSKAGYQFANVQDLTYANKIPSQLQVRKTGLGLMSKVNSDALYFLKTNTPFGEYRSNYFLFDSYRLDMINGRASTVYRIDISAAYWHTAAEVFLSGSTFDYGLKNKPQRLAALGALASKKLQIDFAEGAQVGERELHKDTEGIYYHVCKIVDVRMQDLISRMGNCLGYWVDCVLVAGENPAMAAKIVQAFKAMGYASKVERTVGSLQVEHDFIYLRTVGQGMQTAVQEKVFFTGHKAA
jgi:hypothetical protein